MGGKRTLGVGPQRCGVAFPVTIKLLPPTPRFWAEIRLKVRCSNASDTLPPLIAAEQILQALQKANGSCFADVEVPLHMPALHDIEDLLKALRVAALLPLNEVLCKLAKSDVERQFGLIGIASDKSLPSSLKGWVRL